MSPFAVPIVAMICVFGAIIGLPIARAFAANMNNKGSRSGVTPDVAARLERMEHAIDSIAVEVERISENQRFTTKLLSERVTPGRLE